MYVRGRTRINSLTIKGNLEVSDILFVEGDTYITGSLKGLRDSRLSLTGKMQVESEIDIMCRTYVGKDMIIKGGIHSSRLAIGGSLITRGDMRLHCTSYTVERDTIIGGSLEITSSVIITCKIIVKRDMKTIDCLVKSGGELFVNGSLLVEKETQLEDDSTLDVGLICNTSSLDVGEKADVKIQGDLNVKNSITISSNINVKGTTVCKSMTFTGNLILTNSLRVKDSLLVKGNMKILHNLDTKNLDVEGNVILQKGQTIIQGMARILGDLITYTDMTIHGTGLIRLIYVAHNSCLILNSQVEVLKEVTIEGTLKSKYLIKTPLSQSDPV